MNSTILFGFLSLFLSAAAWAADNSLLYTIGRGDSASAAPGMFTARLLAGVEGTTPDPADISASVKIAWNQRALLLFIEVQDDCPVISTEDDQLWASDSVELFVTPNLGSGSYYQLVLAVEQDGSLRSKFYDFRTDRHPTLQHSTKGQRVTDGCTMNVQLPWSNLNIKPAEGMDIGMQIFVNDRDDDKDAFQLQWYPHAVSHSSDRMHRLRLGRETSDAHRAACRVEPGTEYHTLRMVTRQIKGITDVDVCTANHEKLAGARFEALPNGLQKAAVLLSCKRVKGPTEILLFSGDTMLGKTMLSAPASIDGPLLKQLQNITLAPRNPWGYVFETQTVPEAVWSDAGAIKEAAAEVPPVRWFDANLNEVTSFDKPGRYMAYAQATLLDGRPLRRSATFYAIPAGAHPWRTDTRVVLYHRSRPWWHPWRGRPFARPDYIEGLGFTKTAWDRQMPLLSAWTGKSLMDFFETTPYGPAVLSFLAEEKNCSDWPAQARTPEIADADIHLALKRKLLNLPAGSRLAIPRTVKEQKTATVLKEGSPADAGFADDAPARLDAVCTRWLDRSNEPFAVLIARHGIIFYHKAFGSDISGRPITTDTPLFMASITKFMSAMMLAQMLDQGLLDLDQPVGTFLPDFPAEGDKAITFRQCFTHTTGLKGHYEHGGMHNPWLENAIALELPHLPVGQLHEYNGMGYDLAGKAMEIIAGKSAFRMMHEHLFEPIGMTHTVLDDMATCSTSTPMDIARLAQLLLNGGTYGSTYYFSPETLQKLLPCELNAYYPAINKNWGIGMTWMLTDNPDAAGTGRKYLLSGNVVGHGAASSAVLRIDRQNDLIVIQTRGQAGPNYDACLLQFLKTIDETMIRNNQQEN